MKCLGLCGWILSRRKTEEVDRAFEMATSLQVFLSSQHNTKNIWKMLTFSWFKKKRMRSEQVALAISQMTLVYYFQVFRAGHQYLCWVDTGRMLGTARVRFWCPCSHSRLPRLIDHLLFSSYPDSLVIFTDVQALINSKEKYSPFFMSFSGHILEKLV